MKNPVGRWLMATALLHTLYASVKYGDALRDVAARGLYNSIASDPVRAAAAWFVLFGAGLFILGLAVAALENLEAAAALRPIGWSLLLLAGVGLVLMPASGFWLALPPAVALILLRGRPA